MRTFTALNLAEIADVLDVPRTAVERRWRTARIRLHREQSRDGGPPLATAGG